MRAAFALMLSLLLGLGATQAGWAQGLPARLVPADTIGVDTHLILTIPLDEPAVLEAAAAEIEARFAVTLTAEWPLRSIAVHCLVVDASTVPDVDTLIARMRADPRIRTVQRMQDFRTFESGSFTPLLYNDPLFSIQTGLHQLNAVAAQRFSTGSGIRVGVVDSAIDVDHSDLANRLASEHDFVGDGKDGNTLKASGEAHGTAMAGIIAADASNRIGIVGVAPEAKLVELRACWQAPGKPGRCNSFSLARALNFAILNTVDVINMSLGGPPDPLLEELLDRAVDQGIIVIAAWGEGKTPTFPASVSGVIAAGRTSNAPKGSIPAPSEDVISLAPQNEYRYVSGSSVATAHVAGVVALLLSAHPGLTAERVAKALQSAVGVEDGIPMLDACRALNALGTDSLSKTPVNCSREIPTNQLHTFSE